MKFSGNSRDTIQMTHLISGKSVEDVKNFFTSQICVLILNYLDGKHTDIPLLGRLQIDFDHDEIKIGGVEAQIKHWFEADPYLKKIVGQIKDGNETEIEKLFKDRIKNKLIKFIEEN